MKLLRAAILCGANSSAIWNYLNTQMATGVYRGESWMRLAEIEAHAIGKTTKCSESDKRCIVLQLVSYASGQESGFGQLDSDFSKRVLGILLWHINPRTRATYAQIVAEYVNNGSVANNRVVELQPEKNTQFVEFRKRGVLSLGTVLTVQEVADVIHYLGDKQCSPGHDFVQSAGSATSLELIRQSEVGYASYPTNTILKAPYLMEAANSGRLVELASLYLGCPPTIQAVNLFWTFPGHSPGGVSKFHRDHNDFRSISFYLYLSDVDLLSGHHEYIVQSIDPVFCDRRIDESNADPRCELDFFNPPWSHESAESVFYRDIAKMVGVRGSGFISDPYGLHRGVMPENFDRLLFYAVFSGCGLLPSIPDSGLPISQFGPQISGSESARLRNQRFILP